MKNPPPDRETVKRKWSADKSAGPLVLLAEWVQKRLIQHAYPCEYSISWKERALGPEENAAASRDAYAVEFHSAKGRAPPTAAFWAAFDTVLRIVTYEKNVRAWREDGMLYLDGEYHVDKYGKIKPGNVPPPF